MTYLDKIKINNTNVDVHDSRIPNAPVTSVNGQTGDVNLTIPADNTLVHRTGDEPVGGQKTFSSTIVANGGIDVGQGTVSSEDSQDFSYITTGGGDTLQDALDAKGDKTLIVTVTKSGDTYTADKTYAEIDSAIKSGIDVVVVYDSIFYYLAYEDGSVTPTPHNPTPHPNYHFLNFSLEENNTLYNFYLNFYTNGTITLTEYVLDLSTKANLASPAFTGTPTAPTAAAGTNTTQIATTAFVQSAIPSLSKGSATGGGNAVTDINVNGHTITPVKGATYTTSSDVNSLIAAAISDITSFDYQVVQTLPATGVKGTIYLVLDSDGSGNDIYKEYIYVNNSWELLGHRVGLKVIEATATVRSNNTVYDLTVQSGTLYSAIQTAVAAGQVPVVKCSLSAHTTSFESVAIPGTNIYTGSYTTSNTFFNMSVTSSTATITAIDMVVDTQKTLIHITSTNPLTFTDSNNNSLTHAQVRALLINNTKDVVFEKGYWVYTLEWFDDSWYYHSVQADPPLTISGFYLEWDSSSFNYVVTSDEQKLLTTENAETSYSHIIPIIDLT